MTNGGWTIDAIGAETVYGSGWSVAWTNLLQAGALALSEYSGLGVMRPQLVIEVKHLSRATDAENGYQGMARRLAVSALNQLTPSTNDLLYLATNHGETDSLIPVAQMLRDKESSAKLIEASTSGLFSRTILGTAGNGSVVQSACASGLVALTFGALQARREGRSIAVVAADSLSDIECIGFSVAKAVSTERCQPFHVESTGLTIGEGAAGLKCTWRDAGDMPQDTPAILGFGLSCDAYHSTSPEPEGREIERAWRSAMTMAGVTPADIGAIVLHGTGTASNDSVEAVVYRRIWGDQGPAPCSIKSFVGHTMGAAGLLNVLVARESLKTGLLPPTLIDGDERETLLPVGIGKPIEIDPTLNCLAVASGFGGQNAAVVVGRGTP